ncbi:MAG: putative peptide ABC transporter DppC [Acidimicrobiales bacterium]|nr:MAG: putative peptide ABC transporter DppC [Acidimicrobiales bacterium]
MTDAFDPSSRPGIALAASSAEDVGDPRTFWGDAWRILRRKWLFWVSLTLIVIFVTMAVFPQLYVWPSPSPDDPSGLHCKLTDTRLGPSFSEHWYGTDVQGCDYYAQVTYGARVSLTVALFATLITVGLGILLGGLAGYYGGFLDSIISRTADGFFALPYLVGAIIVLSALTTSDGRQTWHVTVAIGSLGWPAVVRLYRSTVLQVKQLEYVQAARALGASDFRILTRHILPNAVAPTLVYATISMGAVISVEATLSYLGIGLPIDSISWGIMLQEASNKIERSGHLLWFPTGYLIAASLAFVLMGEQLREAFDPRFR